jgi:Uma2 family endonuclease
MTQTKPRFNTIEEYLAYDYEADTRYELVDGVPVEMGAESTINIQIAIFLLLSFSRLGLPDHRLGMKQQIAVSRSRVTAREPDLIVHSEASALAIEGKTQALLIAEMPAPMLVVEVVSPGEPVEENYDRDYIDKRREYALRGISEYWIIDPSRNVMLVLSLQEKQYREIGRFQNLDSVISPMFPSLQITAEQILKAGR